MRPLFSAPRSLSALVAVPFSAGAAAGPSRAPRRAYHASVLPSLVSPGNPEFQERTHAMDALVADLEARLADARAGGGPKAVERMRAKGKMTPRER